MQLLLENSLSMKVFQYKSSVVNGRAALNARIYHTVRIANTAGSQLTVYDGDQRAETDVTMSGNIADWASTNTFLVGPIFKPQRIHTGLSTPPERDPPKGNEFPVFGGRDYIGCSKSKLTNITCPPV